MAKKRSDYVARDPLRLARAAVAWVFISALLNAGVAVTCAFEARALAGLDHSLPLGRNESAEGLETLDLINGLVSLVYLPALAAASFLVLKWIYRTNQNAQTLAPGMDVRPGWAVGWFFVPFASLWKPFQGVKQTWQISTRREGWQTAPFPALLNWWWGLWILDLTLSNAAGRLSFMGKTVGAAYALSVLNIVEGFVYIPLSVLMILIIQRLTALQVSALPSSIDGAKSAAVHHPTTPPAPR